MTQRKTGPSAVPLSRGSLRVYVIVGLINIALAVIDILIGNPWSAFPAFSAGAVFVVFVWHIRLMYRLGWQWGRREMIDSIHEAQQRGLSPNQWLVAEIERTEGGTFLPVTKETDNGSE